MEIYEWAAKSYNSMSLFAKSSWKVSLTWTMISLVSYKFKGGGVLYFLQGGISNQNVNFWSTINQNWFSHLSAFSRFFNILSPLFESGLICNLQILYLSSKIIFPENRYLSFDYSKNKNNEWISDCERDVKFLMNECF